MLTKNFIKLFLVTNKKLSYTQVMQLCFIIFVHAFIVCVDTDRLSQIWGRGERDQREGEGEEGGRREGGREGEEETGGRTFY